MVRALTDSEKRILREEFLPAILRDDELAAGNAVKKIIFGEDFESRIAAASNFPAASASFVSIASTSSIPPLPSPLRRTFYSTRESTSRASTLSFEDRSFDGRSTYSKASGASSLSEEITISSLIPQAMKLLKNNEELEKILDFFRSKRDFIFLADPAPFFDEKRYESFFGHLESARSLADSRLKFLEKFYSASDAELIGILATGRGFMNDFLAVHDKEFERIFLEKLAANPDMLLSKSQKGLPLIHAICAQMTDYSDEFIERFFAIAKKKISEVNALSSEEHGSVFQYFIRQHYYSINTREKVEKILSLFLQNGFELFSGEFSQPQDERVLKAGYQQAFFPSAKIHEREVATAMALVHARHVIDGNPQNTALLDLLLSNGLTEKKINSFLPEDVADFAYFVYQKNSQLFEEKFDASVIEKILPVLAKKITTKFDQDLALFCVKAALKTHSNKLQKALNLIPAKSYAEIFQESDILRYAVKNSLQGNIEFLFKAIEEKVEDKTVLDKILNSPDAEKNTPLHLAIKRNMVGTSAFLVKSGAGIDVKNNEGFTPLMRASKQYSFLILKSFMEVAEKKLSAAEFRKFLNQRDDKGRTALHYAAQQGHQSSAIFLIEKGVDVVSQDSEGNTAAHLAAINGATITAQAICDRNSQLKDIRNSSGQTVETITAAHKILIEPDNIVLQQGDNKLLYAVRNNGSYDSFLRIFSSSDDKEELVSHLDNSGLNALHLACVRPSTLVLKNLLRAAKDSLTPQQFTKFVNSTSRIGMTPLHYLASHGREMMLDVLCENSEVELGKQNAEGNLALHSAIECGATKTFKHLLEIMRDRNVDCGAQNKAGQNIVAHAASIADCDVFRDVIGATKELGLGNQLVKLINQKNCHSNQTVMEQAVRKGNDDIVRLLCELREEYQDIDFKPELMMTAIHNNFSHTAKLLCEFGLTDMAQMKLPGSPSRDDLCAELCQAGCRFDISEVKARSRSYPKLYSIYVNRELKAESDLFFSNAAIISFLGDKFKTPRFRYLDEKISGITAQLVESSQIEVVEAVQEVLNSIQENPSNKEMKTLCANKRNIDLICSNFRKIDASGQKALLSSIGKYESNSTKLNNESYLRGLEEICAKFVEQHKKIFSKSASSQPSSSASRATSAALASSSVLSH